MTRQEAIEWLVSIKDKYIHGGDEQYDDCRRKAIDVAIETLKQPEIVQCKDCKYRNNMGSCGYDKPQGLWDTERMFVKAYCEDEFFCAYGERKGGE